MLARHLADTRVFNCYYSALITQGGSPIIRGRFPAAFATCLLLGLLIAACGSGSGTAGTEGGSTEITTSDLSKAAYVKQVDSICVDATRQRSARLLKESASQAQENSGKQSPSEQEASSEELVSAAALPPMQQQLEKLRDLGAPSGDDQEIEALLEAFEQGLATVEAEPLTLLVRGAKNPMTEFSELAKAYGLQNC